MSETFATGRYPVDMFVDERMDIIEMENTVAIMTYEVLSQNNDTLECRDISYYLLDTIEGTTSHEHSLKSGLLYKVQFDEGEGLILADDTYIYVMKFDIVDEDYYTQHWVSFYKGTPETIIEDEIYSETYPEPF